MHKLLFILLLFTSCSNVKLGMRAYDNLGGDVWHFVSINNKYPDYFTIQDRPNTKQDQIVEILIPKSELK